MKKTCTCAGLASGESKLTTDALLLADLYLTLISGTVKQQIACATVNFLGPPF